jgi:ribonucleoside-diphosphate reductase alpha chain
LSTNATIDDVYDIDLEAHKLRLKGITIYRDKCKENQPLNKIEALPLPPLTEENKLLEKQFPEFYGKAEYRKRGPVAIGVTHKVDTGKGKIYITINYSEYHSEPVEVFIRLGHLSTSTEAALAEYTGRLISLLLKYNVPLETIERQGNKVYADTIFWYNQQSFCSFPKLISHLLSYDFEEAMNMAEMDFESMLENGHDEEEEIFGQSEMEEIVEKTALINKEKQGMAYCYNCGEYGIIQEGGCKFCMNCGDEKCG